VPALLIALLVWFGWHGKLRRYRQFGPGAAQAFLRVSASELVLLGVDIPWLGLRRVQLRKTWGGVRRLSYLLLELEPAQAERPEVQALRQSLPVAELMWQRARPGMHGDRLVLSLDGLSPGPDCCWLVVLGGWMGARESQSYARQAVLVQGRESWLAAALAGVAVAAPPAAGKISGERLMALQRMFLLLPLAFALSGCMATGWVSAIGMHEQSGRVARDAPFGSEVEITDVALEHAPIAGPCVVSPMPPYTGFDPVDKGVSLGFFTYRSSQADGKGTVLVALPGGERRFAREVYGDGDITRRYRRWYGYPAQALQVVALPLDVVIDTGIAVALPFVWLALETHKPPKAAVNEPVLGK
jgi:hypothetical protein